MERAMAGDWIKLEHGILDKPEVMELSEMLDASPYEIVGHLVEFWFWCDHNLSPECPRVKGTKRGLDRVAGRDGFGDALISVGWLTFADGYFSVPNYDTHLSKSAKQRAKDQRKKAFQRSSVSRFCPDSVPYDRGTKPGPEKRREEKRRDKEKNNSRMAFESESFEAQWQRWAEYRQQKWDAGYSEIELDSVQMSIAAAFGPAGESEAVAALEYSIAHGAKNPILNGDHRKREVSVKANERKKVTF
jgi:hypothetical protein